MSYFVFVTDGANNGQENKSYDPEHMIAAVK
jgi:hypothetical protein